MQKSLQNPNPDFTTFSHISVQSVTKCGLEYVKAFRIFQFLSTDRQMVFKSTQS